VVGTLVFKETSARGRGDGCGDAVGFLTNHTPLKSLEEHVDDIDWYTRDSKWPKRLQPFPLFLTAQRKLRNRVGWVVDCGSGHTATYKYAMKHEELTELYKHKLYLPNGDDVALGPVLELVERLQVEIMAAADAECVAIMEEAQVQAKKVGMSGGGAKMMEAAQTKCDAVMEKAVGDVKQMITAEYANVLGSVVDDIQADNPDKSPDQFSILFGATGGVRDLLDTGKITLDTLRTFAAELKEVCGAKADFSVLSGEEEARCELVAAQRLFKPTFRNAEFDTFGLVSGGGMSCQFVYTRGGIDVIKSIRMNTFAAQELLDEEGASNSTIRQIEKDFNIVMSQAEVPSNLTGAYLATAVQQTVAAVCGFDCQFVLVRDIREIVSAAIPDLLNRSGPAFEGAKAKYGNRIDAMCGVVLVLTVRLRVILSKFSDNALFYFAREPPEQPMNVEWTVGKFLERM